MHREYDLMHTGVKKSTRLSLDVLQLSFPSLREIKLLQQMKHENIIELIEICTSKGTMGTDNEEEERGQFLSIRFRILSM